MSKKIPHESDYERMSDKELATWANDNSCSYHVKWEQGVRQVRKMVRGHKTRELHETLETLKAQESRSESEWIIMDALHKEIEARKAFYNATHAPKAGFTLGDRLHA